MSHLDLSLTVTSGHPPESFPSQFTMTKIHHSQSAHSSPEDSSGDRFSHNLTEAPSKQDVIPVFNGEPDITLSCQILIILLSPSILQWILEQNRLPEYPCTFHRQQIAMHVSHYVLYHHKIPVVSKRH